MTLAQSGNPPRLQAEALKADLYSRCRSHVLSRLSDVATDTSPFHHLFIDEIFPADFYASLHDHMVALKHGDSIEARTQDNPDFVTQRCNLFESTDDVASCIRAVFSDPGIKEALLEKFYVGPLQALAGSLSIHQEFEYTFTKAGRFQNVHVDIPPKFLSFVFYIPEHPVPPNAQKRNATILYDKSLAPRYRARYLENSVCIFAPHFYSYHGFSSSIDREALVMFCVNAGALSAWQSIRRAQKEQPPFAEFLDGVERKLRAHPLKEYWGGEDRVISERAACLVNAPQGRVLG